MSPLPLPRPPKPIGRRSFDLASIHVEAIRARSIASALVCSLGAALACAWPGQPVPVLPEILGAVDTGAAGSDPRLLLLVMHRETPSLHARQEIAVGRDGDFRFAPVFLDVAGHEFSKHYRVYLHLREGDTDRVIWRADLSRLEAPLPISLDCELARPLALGEICRVRDPVRQPWLIAEGRKSFARLCARCHGADGRGTDASPAAGQDAATVTPPDLTQIAARHGGRFDHDRVAAWIEGRSLSANHASNGMPVWGERLSNAFARYAEGDELIGATLDPLVAFLESLQAGRPSIQGPSVERPARGD